MERFTKDVPRAVARKIAQAHFGARVTSKPKKPTRELLVLGRVPKVLVGKDLDHLTPDEEKVFDSWLETIVDAIGDKPLLRG